MQTPKNRLATYLAAGIMGSTAFMAASPAVAFDPSLSSSVGISNMYLFRGLNLSGGSAHITGSLDVDSGMGLYAGAWAASGDDALGQEVDLYAGYATDITDDISVDAGVVNLTYPNQSYATSPDLFGDLTEAYLGVSAFGASVNYVDTIAGLPGYTYISAGYGVGPVSATIGQHNFDSAAQGNDFGGVGEDMTHLDLTFQVNDEVSFTASTIVSADNDSVRRYPQLKASYSKSFDFK